MGWTDELLTGIDEIDRQHQVLFDCIARLEHAVTGEERWSAVHFALEEVSEFSRIHFAVEEALMRLHDYPDFDAHIDEHRAFVVELNTLKEKSIRTDVGDEMVAFLKKWLARHIHEIDQQYVPHLRSANVVTTN